MSWFGLFDKTTDLISEAIEDPDKLNAIKGNIEILKQERYTLELQTKTVPWVDALHKMGRQITGYIGYALAFYMVHKGYDPMAAMAAVAPGGIYAAFKNKGKL
ncbi:MAG: hypothetical protein JKY50_00510 [Oleispira sp.]|nr:hypothetical protein [Oleispira sp.]